MIAEGSRLREGAPTTPAHLTKDFQFSGLIHNKASPGNFVGTEVKTRIGEFRSVTDVGEVSPVVKISQTGSFGHYYLTLEFWPACQGISKMGLEDRSWPTCWKETARGEVNSLLACGTVSPCPQHIMPFSSPWSIHGWCSHSKLATPISHRFCSHPTWLLTPFTTRSIASQHPSNYFLDLLFMVI